MQGFWLILIHSGTTRNYRKTSLKEDIYLEISESSLNYLILSLEQKDIHAFIHFFIQQMFIE